MRDWWWGHCKRADTSPAILLVNQRIAELQLTQGQSFDQLKEILLERSRIEGEAIRKASTLRDLGAASGVSVPFPGATEDPRVVPASPRTRLDEFLGVASQTAELLAEMKRDLFTPGVELVREFVALDSEGVVFNSSKPHFVYYGQNHQLEVDLLEQHGFVEVVKHGSYDLKIYRMTEELVGLLKSWDPPSA